MTFIYTFFHAGQSLYWQIIRYDDFCVFLQ